MKEATPTIVGIGGTLRSGSTSERALSAALEAARRHGAEVRMFSGTELALDPYDPSLPGRSAPARMLIDALRVADGVIIATPGYHGSISGLVKNALDYTEDLRTDVRPYFEGRAVGCIVCAEGIQALGSTLQTVRSIVHALRGWPTPFAALINSAAKPFGPDGEIRDTVVAQHLDLLAAQVVEFASVRLRDDLRRAAA